MHLVDDLSPSGFIASPLGSGLRIARVERLDDSSYVPLDNVWQTDRVFPDSKKWLYEDRIHFVGYFASGSETYRLTLGNADGIKGDVNGDGVVDVADIAAIIDIMAGKQ